MMNFWDILEPECVYYFIIEKGVFIPNQIGLPQEHIHTKIIYDDRKNPGFLFYKEPPYTVLHMENDEFAFCNENRSIRAVNGFPHSLNYPAIINHFPNKNYPSEQYFINGVEYSKAEWFLKKAEINIS